MRTLIIGDIHGCVEELKELLSIFNPTPQDKIYSVGDVINKGEDSRACIRILKSFNIKPVLGNHEYWYLNRYPFDEDSKWKAFYDLNLSIDDVLWLKTLPLFIENDRFILVHGGFDPRIGLEKTDKETLVSIRTLDINKKQIPWYDLYEGEKPVYFGHWAALGLHRTKNTICLDSGCVYGKFLTGYIVEEDKFIKISAKKIYHAITRK